jgi:hypothetical protein
MDFDDISRVCPRIEISTDLGIDLNAEQKANPRVFKSHLDAGRIPKRGRYTRERSVEVCGVPADSDSTKVRSGHVGESRQLNFL